MLDRQGLALSTGNQEALNAYNQAISDLLEYRLSAMPQVKLAIEQDPSFAMAHCLRGYMLMMISSFRVLDNARGALALAQQSLTDVTPREALHVQALERWISGDLIGTCAIWQSIILQYPLDILALRLHHFSSFWMGRTPVLLGTPAGVLEQWDPSIPNYGNVLGMLAFGLQENGQYAKAEQYGRAAVELSADDLWAVHAVAHVMEMQHRFDEGIDWFDTDADTWHDRNPFRGHLWWHLGLFLREANRFDEAIALYDRAIQANEAGFYLDIQNAASFLTRLEFSGIDVGNRWKSLADHAEANLDDHSLVFTDLHCVMALAREKRFDQAERYIQSMRNYAASNDFHAAQVMRRVGIGVCEGIVAFEQQRFEDALSLIMTRHPLLNEVGASNAQRDIVTQFAIQAAKREGNTAALRYLDGQTRFCADLAKQSR